MMVLGADMHKRSHNATRSAPPRAHASDRGLQKGITDLVGRVAPQLLDEPGFEPLTAAELVGEIAGADRIASDAKLPRAAGLAPIPVSSGKTTVTA